MKKCLVSLCSKIPRELKKKKKKKKKRKKSATPWPVPGQCLGSAWARAWAATATFVFQFLVGRVQLLQTQFFIKNSYPNFIIRIDY
jgi:hypothetical protein